MSKLGLVGAVAVVLGLAFLGMEGCSASPEGDDDDGSSSSGSGGTGAGTTTTGLGGDIGLGGQGTGGGCGPSCSADLKQVLDCNGVVIETCTGDQACLNGTCTDDPCGAAEASKSSYGCNFWAVKPDVIPSG
ncbi:MAG: hypothetical protein JRI68_19530, partial [Deltaproteobacteria bacterium]|nr:hypothetical protein [Deltaproteobacteria bacterium]